MGTNGQPPSSFGDLVSRKKHLQDASKYLEIVLKDRSSGFVSHIPSFLADEKLLTNREISISEMKRYLTTVNLQMEVTEFMYNLEEKEGKIAEKPISTLFGNGKERAELAVKVINCLMCKLSFSFDCFICFIFYKLSFLNLVVHLFFFFFN